MAVIFSSVDKGGRTMSSSVVYIKINDGRDRTVELILMACKVKMIHSNTKKKHTSRHFAIMSYRQYVGVKIKQKLWLILAYSV